jgi:hypothetical protein
MELNKLYELADTIYCDIEKAKYADCIKLAIEIERNQIFKDTSQVLNGILLQLRILNEKELKK